MIGLQIMGAMLILGSIFGGIEGEGATTSKTTIPVAKTIELTSSDTEGIELEDYVKQFFTDEPLLVEIAKCESTMTHVTPSGAVVRGKVNSKDVGLMQINENYHLERATALGFDIHSLEGNMAYARYLFAKEGSQPWSASSKCWTKTEAYKEFALKQ